jgi:hypothetical protein
LAIGVYSAEQVQANWLLRSYFALAAAGVDRAAMFMFRDTKSSGGGVFETCGLVTEKGQWKPKPSYFYVATLKKRLTGYRFAGIVPSRREDALVYRFAAPSGKSAFAVWCPTSSDKRVPGVPISVRGTTVRRIDFATGAVGGVETRLSVKGGHVTVEALEQPLLILE